MPVCRIDCNTGHTRRGIAIGDLPSVIAPADAPSGISTNRRIIQNRNRIPDTVVIKFNPLNKFKNEKERRKVA